MSTKSLCDFILCSVSDVLLYYYLQGVPKKCPFLVFWSSLVNQMSYRKSSTMWIKLKLSAFSNWLYIFCSTFWYAHYDQKKITKSAKNQLKSQILIFLDFLQFSFDRHGWTKCDTENIQPCEKSWDLELSSDGL